MKQDFEIAYFSLRPDIIDVRLERGINSIMVSIPRERFEFWLLRNNKLVWQITKREGEVHRVEEVEGVMSLTEYYGGDKLTIYIDLYDYITTNQTVYQGQVYSHNTKSIINALTKNT